MKEYFIDSEEQELKKNKKNRAESDAGGLEGFLKPTNRPTFGNPKTKEEPKQSIKPSSPSQSKVEEPKELPKPIQPKAEPKPFIAKRLDVLNRNINRLLNTDFGDMIGEIFKNDMEYGTNMDISFDDTKGEIKFSNGLLDQNTLKTLTFKGLMDKLTSFKIISGSNFNEGLTTLLLVKYILRVGDLCIIAYYSGDNYFQLVDAKRSSHYYLNDNDEPVKNPAVNFPFIDKWEITIQANETEEILTKEGTNLEYNKKFEHLYETLKHLIKDEMLPLFVFPEDYQIKVDKEKIKSPEMKYDLASLSTSRWYYDGQYYDYLYKFDISEDQKVEVYWKLSRQGFFQQIRTKELDDQGVMGSVILSNNIMIDGLNRRNIKGSLRDQIKYIIKNHLEANFKDSLLANLIKDYEKFRDSAFKFIGSVFQVSQQNIKIFFKTENLRDKSQKEAQLIRLFSFIYTFRELFEKATDVFETEFNELIDFTHPKQKLKLSNDEFRSILEALSIKIENISNKKEWEDQVICFLIATKGELNAIHLKDLRSKNQQIRGLPAIDQNHTLVVALSIENTQPFLFPNEITDAILALEYVEPETLTGLHSIKIKKIEGLEEMAIKPDETLYQLRSQREKLEEETRLLETLRQKAEEELEQKRQIEQQLLERAEKQKLVEEIKTKEAEAKQLEEKQLRTEKKIAEIEKKEAEIDPNQIKERLNEEKEQLKKEIRETAHEIAEKTQSDDPEEREEAKQLEKALEKREEVLEQKEKEIIQQEKELIHEITSEDYNKIRGVADSILENRGVMNDSLRKLFTGSSIPISIDQLAPQMQLDFLEALRVITEANSSNDDEKIVKDLFYSTSYSKEVLEQAKEYYAEESQSNDETEEYKEVMEKKKEAIEESLKKYEPTASIQGLLGTLKARVESVSKVENGGQEVEIAKITIDDDLNLLYLFNKEGDKKRFLSKGKLKGIRVIRMYYNALLKAISLLGPLAQIDHPLYLAFEYNDSEPEIAFYMQDYGMVVFNCFEGQQVLQGMDKTSKSFEIAHLIAHELTHEVYSKHTQSFYQLVDDLTTDFNKKKGYKLIRKEL